MKKYLWKRHTICKVSQKTVDFNSNTVDFNSNTVGKEDAMPTVVGKTFEIKYPVSRCFLPSSS